MKKYYQIKNCSDYDKEIVIKRNDNDKATIKAFKKKTVKRKDEDIVIAGEYRKSKDRETIGFFNTINQDTDEYMSLELYEPKTFNRWVFKETGYVKIEDNQKMIAILKRRLWIPFLFLAGIGGGTFVVADMIINPPETPKPPALVEKQPEKEKEEEKDVIEDIIEKDEPVVVIPVPKPLPPIAPKPLEPTKPITPPKPVTPPEPEKPIVPAVPKDEEYYIFTRNEFGDITSSTQIKKDETIKIEFDVSEDYEFEDVTINDIKINVSFDKETGKGSFDVSGTEDKSIVVNAKRKVHMIDTDIDHGFITPLTVVVAGHSVKIEFEFHTGYELKEITVNGKATQSTAYDKETGKGYINIKPKEDVKVNITSSKVAQKFKVTTKNKYGTVTPSFEVKEGTEVKINYTIDMNMDREKNDSLLVKGLLANGELIETKDFDVYDYDNGSCVVTITEDTEIEVAYFKEYNVKEIGQNGTLFHTDYESTRESTLLEIHETESGFSFDNYEYEFKYLLVNGVKTEPTKIHLEDVDPNELNSTVEYNAILKEDTVIEYVTEKRNNALVCYDTNKKGKITDFKCYEGNPYNLPVFKDIVIPQKLFNEDLVTIGQGAFKNKGLNSVVIANSIKDIESSAFVDNRLTKVEFEEGSKIEKIGYGAFQGVYNAKTNNITSLKIPGTIREIGANAFYFNKITVLTIEDGEGYVIKDQAFYQNKISNAKLGNVTEIGNEAFGQNLLKEINLPHSLKTIGNNAFLINPLENLFIPNSVASIGNSAFAETSLKTLIFEENSQIKTIGDYAFSNSSQGRYLLDFSNATIEIPASIETLNPHVFNGTKIGTLKLNEGLKVIGNNAFANTQIANVVISKSVEIIGNGAFAMNSFDADYYAKTRSLKIGNNVKRIEPFAFMNMNLNRVIIPDSVEYVGGSAFINSGMPVPSQLSYLEVSGNTTIEPIGYMTGGLTDSSELTIRFRGNLTAQEKFILKDLFAEEYFGSKKYKLILECESAYANEYKAYFDEAKHKYENLTNNKNITVEIRTY